MNHRARRNINMNLLTVPGGGTFGEEQTPYLSQNLDMNNSGLRSGINASAHKKYVT